MKTKHKPFLSKDEIEICRKARKILKKVQRKIDTLEDLRELYDEQKSPKWKDTTEKLYALLDETYNKAHITNVACLDPTMNYCLLDLGI